MIDLDLFFFRYLNGRCHGTDFVQKLPTPCTYYRLALIGLHRVNKMVKIGSVVFELNRGRK